MVWHHLAIDDIDWNIWWLDSLGNTLLVFASSLVYIETVFCGRLGALSHGMSCDVQKPTERGVKPSDFRLCPLECGGDIEFSVVVEDFCKDAAKVFSHPFEQHFLLF